MQKIFLIAIFCLHSFLGTIWGDEADNSRDKQNINDRLQSFTQEFNKGTVEPLMQFWSEDVQFVNPVTGEDIIGKKDVLEVTKKRLQQLKGKTVSFKVRDITFPKTNAAIVDGVVLIRKNGRVINQLARQVELIKNKGQWFIDSISEIEIGLTPAISNIHLKSLAWLAGKWKDMDEDVSILYSTKWDKFHNFIVQEFSMKVYGLESLEGRQIIGWDPIENKIRSWIFDSDGGYGTGLWTNQKDSWKAVIEYVLSDGKKASSVNIYKKIDDKSYSYSSIDRIVDGKKIPDIDPHTIVREE